MIETHPSVVALSFVLAVDCAPKRSDPGVDRTETTHEHSRDESIVVSLVNHVRSRPGVCGRTSAGPSRPLRLDGDLDRMARETAGALVAANRLSHRVDGLSAEDRAARSGVSRFGGEVLYSGHDTVADVVAGWTESTVHCTVIRDELAERVGLAIHEQPDDRGRRVIVLVTGRASESP